MNNKTKKLLAVVSAILVLTSLATWVFLNPGYLNCVDSTSHLPRVAHAGGGYKGLGGTDSIDALNYNLKKYDLFELDFMVTSDGEVVCIHDWEESATFSFGVQLAKVPTIAEFNRLNSVNKKYTHCTLSSLMDWLERNPQKRIVTDVKDDNLYVLKEIAKRYPPERMQRFIPQIYFPSEYDEVRALGYKDIIFTLYRYGKSDSKFLRNARSMDLYALTIPSGRAKTLAPRAACLGIPTYAHTVNDSKEFDRLKSYGIVEIYTDWMFPR